MDIEELHKKIEHNTNRIINNSKQIKSNANKIGNNAQKIQQNSYALEILKDYKRQNKRLFIILIVMLIIWVATIIAFHI